MRCVQNQLAALDYDPGAADGLLGPRTQAAFQTYASRTAQSAHSPLSIGNAVAWCRRTGIWHPELQRFWPATEAQTRVIIGAGVNTQVADMVQQQFPSSHRSVRRDLGVDVAGTDWAIVGSSLTDLERLVALNLPHLGAATDLRAALIERCGEEPLRVGAVHMPGVTVICVPPDTGFGPSFSPSGFRGLILREVTHLIIDQLLGTPPDGTSEADWVRLDGPICLREGLPNYRGERGRGTSASQVRLSFQEQMRGRDFPRMRDLESRVALDTMRLEVEMVGGIAVSILLNRQSDEEIGTLLEVMAARMPFDLAFRTAFAGDWVTNFYARVDNQILLLPR